MSDNTPREIEDLYARLEEQSPETIVQGTVGDVFRALREGPEKTEKEPWARLSTVESFVLSCYLQAGEIQGKHALPQGLDAEAIDYLNRRAGEAGSSTLRARYSHFLWDDTRSRHRDHAVAAIEAYLQAVRLCCEMLHKSSDRGVILSIAEMLAASLKLCLAAGINTDDVLASAISVFDLSTSNEHDKWTLRTFVCREIVRIKFPRRVEFLKSILELLEKDFDDYLALATPYIPHDIADTAVEICRIAQVPENVWLVRRAQASLANAKSRDLDDIASLGWIHDAIQDFQAAGDREAANTWLREYEQCSGKVHYGVVSTEIDMTETYRRFNEIAEDLIGRGAEAIFEFLAQAGEPLVPSLAKVRDRAEKLCESSPLLGMAPHVIQDKLGRPIKQHSGPEGAQEHWTFWYYGQQISAYTLELLKRILLPSIQKGVFSTATLKQWLTKGSWLGSKLTRALGNGETIDFIWADVILPSVSHYESEVRRYLDTNGGLPDLLLSIDSLATKMEGIVRDLLGLLGSTTTQAKQKRGQRTIEGRSLDNLLEDPVLRDNLGEDDVFLIRFILTEKAGWNLRADVAHSLLSRQEYIVQIFHVLLLLVFRLSTFQLQQETPEPST